MPYIQESYKITSDNESSSVYIEKDSFDNLEITLKDPNGMISLNIPEELISKFVYAINRINTK